MRSREQVRHVAKGTINSRRWAVAIKWFPRLLFRFFSLHVLFRGFGMCLA